MNRLRFALWGCCLCAVLLAATDSPVAVAQERGTRAAQGAQGDHAGGTATAAAGERLVPVPTAQANRSIIRVNLDKAVWQATDGANGLGVQTAIIEGDPAKPGFYMVINKFPPGVMSRPHYHPDERHAIVIKGTWYTGEGDEFTPAKTVPLKPGDYMRHPAGAHHYDGARDEEVIVAISGYGPSGSTVIDGGARFGRSR